MWMDSGDIVLIADSMGVRDTYDANGTAQEPKAPLALLVNKGTASASEVGCPLAGYVVFDPLKSYSVIWGLA